MPNTLHDIRTPALILDRRVLERNCEALAEKFAAAGVNLRPHMKTAKSHNVARIATRGHTGAITVSTLNEAEFFVRHGFLDILYAVGIVPEKLPAVAELQRAGAAVHLLTDNLEIAAALDEHARALDTRFSVYLDIDCGYRRAGVDRMGDALLELGRCIAGAARVELRGVLTHAGHSYEARDIDGIRAVAEEERLACVRAAERLRTAGVACPEVSPGSTPTAVLGESFEGVTECRPGNYMFYDLSMVARHVCTLEDIAVSVLSSVIVAQPERNHAVIDAGMLALSKDTGANFGSMDGVGFGLVRDLHNQRDTGAVVRNVSQEHGWLAPAPGRNALPTDEFPIGRRVRVLPNHSCATAAAYDRYHVVDDSENIVAEWPRTNGW